MFVVLLLDLTTTMLGLLLRPDSSFAIGIKKELDLYHYPKRERAASGQ